MLDLSCSNQDGLMLQASEHLVLDAGLDQQAGNGVGVNVGSGAAVLQVAIALQHDGQGNADGRATVSNTVLEGVDVAGLVPAGQALVVLLAVLGDVLSVGLGQLVNGGLNVL